MFIQVDKIRKDGKYPVTYCFENGKRIKKIVSRDQIIMDYHKNYEIRGLYIDPMEWPEKNIAIYENETSF